MIKEHIVGGHLPCGCGGNPRWNESQCRVLCSRAAAGLGYSFIGFQGEWLNQKTLVRMLCDKHGEWSSGNIANLRHSNNGCPDCKIDTLIKYNRRSDRDWTDVFMETGSYKTGTEFTRTDQRNKQGSRSYWKVTCSVCKESHVRSTSNLIAGKVPCSCRLKNKKSYAYILLISDDQIEIGIKFGITSNIKERLSSLNSKNSALFTLVGLWEFSSRTQAAVCEKECLSLLECGIVSRVDVSDGWTETTYCYNIDKLISIYEAHSGICVHYNIPEKEVNMPELEYEDFNEIMSHQQSHIAMELGEDLAAILAEVGQDE